MGIVYKAQDLKLNRLVALKFLPPAMQNDQTVMARFQHEAQAIAALNHPHIATIHALEEWKGQRFIVLEYLPGGTLKEKLKDGTLPIQTVLDYAAQIGEGLAYAHKSGIVHRDMKTENIMLGSEGRLKITDFGLAKLQGMTRVTKTGSTGGTAAYTSPEQAKGEEADARSDIFSFGIVLYELMTGALPFKGDHEVAILYGVLHETPNPMYEIRSDVPASFEKIVKKAVEKKAAKRYQQVEEMLVDLRQTSPADKPTTRLTKIFKKSRRWAIPVAALILVSLIPFFKRHFLPPPPVSVAVLPFEVTGGNTDENAWLMEGLGQSIATKLTKLKDVRVTPWVTSQRYSIPSNSLKDSLKVVASEIGVERLLIGTIRIFGDKVHAAVQLIDQTGSQQVWSDEFDESRADIFEVYKKIALGVAEGLKGNFSGEEEQLLAQPPAQRADAYELYIRGSLKLQDETSESNDEALAFFDRATELDPNLADAYVGKGGVYENRFFYIWGGNENLDKAEGSFKKALELDPQSTAARRGLSWVISERGRFEDVLKLGAAVSKNENDIEALSVRADAYFSGGLPDKAVPLYERILQLDPVNNGALWHLVIALTWSLQAEKAIDIGETYFEKFGEDAEVHLWIAVAHQMLKDLDAAAIHFDRALELFGSQTRYADLYAVALYSQLGDTAKAKAYATNLLHRLEEKFQIYPSNFRLLSALAGCNAFLGNYDEATKFETYAHKDLYASDESFFIFPLLWRAGHQKMIQDMIHDMLVNHTDLLFMLRMWQAMNVVGESDISYLKKRGFLAKLTQLNVEHRAKY